MKPTHVLSALLLAAALSMSPCAAAGTTKKPIGPLATVNGEALTVDELREGFVKRHGGHEKFLGGEQELRKFVEIMLDQRLLIQEAYNLGLQDDPTIRQAVDEFGEKKAIEYLVRSEVDDRLLPSAEDVRAVWEKHAGRLFTVQEIVVDTEAQADEIRRMLLSGGGFDAIARACSIVPSRMHGGRLGSVAWGTLDPAWENTVFVLEPGEVSTAFRTRTGWTVAQLLDSAEVPRPDFGAVKSKIEGVLTQRRREELRAALSDSMWSRFHVSIAPIDHDVATLARLRRSAPETVLVSWDGGSLTVRDFPSDGELRMMAAIPPGRAAQFFDDQLRAAVNEPLVRLEAERRNIRAVPAVAEPVRRYQEDLMERLLYADHVLKGVEVTEADVRAYFDSHKDELKTPERRRVAHLVVASEADAQAIRAKVIAGESWDELVKKHSTDVQSVREGGDLGWVTARETPEQFHSVLTLAEGEVSAPIHSRFGWHMVKVVKIEPARPMTFDEAKSDLTAKLGEERKREKRAYWVKQLRAAAKIRISDRAIREYVAQNPFEEPKATPQSH